MFTISVSGFPVGPVPEVDEIRLALDNALLERGMRSCATVANTIFPQALWNPAAPADRVFARYSRIRQRVLRYNPRGTYFDRMIAYGPTRLNQLDYVLQTWRSGNHRRSALQILILDPSKDDTNERRRGFPCMSQVSFSYDNTRRLAVTGYYPTQYIFQRAYGNLLGLARLGTFMAQELGLTMGFVNCFVVTAQCDESIKATVVLSERLMAILRDVENRQA